MRKVVCTFAVPKLTSGQLSTTFNPTGPSLERVLAKFRGTAVPVNGHKVDGILVRSGGAENGRAEETELQLSLKESDGFLKMTAATQQSAQLSKDI